jgi:hypothetical protein
MDHAKERAAIIQFKKKSLQSHSCTVAAAGASTFYSKQLMIFKKNLSPYLSLDLAS